jgi:adenylate cyclase
MKYWLVTSSALICASVYLFVSAPEKLPVEGERLEAQNVDGERLFHAVNALNHHARKIYTSEIVGKGKKVGLKFGEDWAERGVEKGPLPALFLREFSKELERRPEPLGLYLGSDEPINVSNLFTGSTATDYQKLVATEAPVFSNIDGFGKVAMFPDIASAQGCVTCHNEHPDSPKKDWVLNEVMGATTWTWPQEYTSAEEMQVMLQVAVDALGDAYGNYLEKTEEFSTPPLIGEDWPESGQYALPSKEVYLARVIEESAPDALRVLLEYLE